MSTPLAGTTSLMASVPGLTAVGQAGPWIKRGTMDSSVQATVDGVGVVTATIAVEVSNGPDTAPVPLSSAAATITLSGTTSDSDGFLLTAAAWKYVRLKVIAISGTGAKVTGLVGA